MFGRSLHLNLLPNSYSDCFCSFHMVGVSTPQWEALERWSPTLFLIAGVVLVVYATFNGIVAFTDVTSRTVKDVTGPAGFVFGFVGLLGLYPTIAGRSPRLARAGAVSAVLGAVGFSTITLQGLARLAGVEPPAWLGIFVLVAAIGMVSGFLSFGAGTLRTDVHSRALGLLLLAPATIFAVMVTQAVLFAQWGLFSETTMAWSAFTISGGQALAYLVIGYSLRTGLTTAEREVPSGDVTAS